MTTTTMEINPTITIMEINSCHQGSTSGKDGGNGGGGDGNNVVHADGKGECSLDFIKYMHGKLLELRNIEVNVIWQRAMFFGSLSCLLFTGYGYLLAKKFETVGLRKAMLDTSPIACPIALLGLIFALLWIYLFRGSKAWLMNYQQALQSFTTRFWSEKYLGKSLADDVKKYIEYLNSQRKLEDFIGKKLCCTGAGFLDELLAKHLDAKLCPTIQILVLTGVVMAFVWQIIFCVHLGPFCWKLVEFCGKLVELGMSLGVPAKDVFWQKATFVSMLVVVNVVVPLIVRRLCRSRKDVFGGIDGFNGEPCDDK